MGGPQNRPFVFYPKELPYDGKPIIWASGLYRLLRGWREQVQHMNGNSENTQADSQTQAPSAQAN
jgi:hypothetical protein